MDKSDKSNSDERLLKLIEGSAETHKQNTNLSPKKLPGNFLPAKLKDSFKFIQKIKFNLPDFNKALIGGACIFTMVFIFKLFSPVGSAIINPALKSSAGSKLTGTEQAQNTVRKTTLSQNLKRNFFLPPGIKLSGLPEDAGINIGEEMKDLKLVGIIWSDNPEVMIETSKDSRTYTLKKGDIFGSGKFKIKEITDNSVTLEVYTADKVNEYILR